MLCDSSSSTVDGPPCPRDADNPDRANGEFPMVIEMVKRLKKGRRAKQLLDMAINECDTIQNLRTAIAKCDNYAKGVEQPVGIDAKKDPSFWIRRGNHYLSR